MAPPHIIEALNYVLDKVCAMIHNHYINKICDEIETLHTFKELSASTDQSSLDMFDAVHRIRDYKIYRLLLSDGPSL
jgi:hypothetical protein